MPRRDKPRYACSWSGGKDACLALHRAIRQWGPPAALVNVLSEDGEHSHSHGLPRRVLEAQADAVGAPIVFGRASWVQYEAVFVEILQSLSAEGITHCVFGDIDLQVHRDWEEMVCARAEMRAELPIWHEEHEALVSEFLCLGYAATLVTIDLDRVPERFLGRALSPDTCARLTKLGIDVSGEGGEFHTVVTNGPVFSRPVSITPQGTLRTSHYAVLKLR
jgi:uncharacterized protein (TIGR00290 family)